MLDLTHAAKLQSIHSISQHLKCLIIKVRGHRLTSDMDGNRFYDHVHMTIYHQPSTKRLFQRCRFCSIVDVCRREIKRFEPLIMDDFGQYVSLMYWHQELVQLSSNSSIKEQPFCGLVDQTLITFDKEDLTIETGNYKLCLNDDEIKGLNNALASKNSFEKVNVSEIQQAIICMLLLTKMCPALLLQILIIIMKHGKSVISTFMPYC